MGAWTQASCAYVEAIRVLIRWALAVGGRGAKRGDSEHDLGRRQRIINFVGARRSHLLSEWDRWTPDGPPFMFQDDREALEATTTHRMSVTTIGSWSAAYGADDFAKPGEYLFCISGCSRSPSSVTWRERPIPYLPVAKSWSGSYRLLR